MPRVTGPAADQATAQMEDQVGELLSAGSKTKVGLYTYGRGIGYLVVAVRGGVKSGSGSSGDGPDATAGWTKTEVNGATCMSKSRAVRPGPGGHDVLHPRLLATGGHRVRVLDAAAPAGRSGRRDSGGVGRPVSDAPRR